MDINQKQYSSRLATIFTLVGVAVGLGNVWRFPYMMGQYGGSAFFAVYLVFTLLFAVPALMAEMSLGRETRGGTLVAFRSVFGRNWGSAVGFLLLFTILIAGSYYAVVVANVFFTTGYSVAAGFDSPESIASFKSILENGWAQYAVTLGLVSIALLVVHLGLRRGIELISKIAVPFFTLSIIVLIVYALSLPGAFGHLLQFMRPDLAALTSEQVFAALGQSFFSVGLGGTFMIVYGGYLRESESIPKIAIATCLGDTGASLLASLFLVPTILVFGLDIASGPGLIFATLPELFGQMPAGRLLGSLFLLALSAVAFLSLVAAYEVFVEGVDKEVLPKIERGKVVVMVGIAMAVLTLPTNLYPSLIGTLDLIFGSGMQVFGSILAVIGVTWAIGSLNARRQIFGMASESGVSGIIFGWMKWAVPAVLLSVLFGYIYTVFGY
jgi:NSS family neurotransmitter:Na+ symporter